MIKTLVKYYPSVSFLSSESISSFAKSNFLGYHSKSLFLYKSVFRFCNETTKSNNFSLLELDQNTYQASAEEALDSIYNQLDNDKYAEKISDLEYHEGVLNVTICKSDKYVLNLQRPNKQIWLSSPISGPQRFELYLNKETNEKEWLNKRTFKSIKALMSEELTLLMGGNKNSIFKITLH